jgi:hypothetical protein
MNNKNVELVLLNPRGEIEAKPEFALAPRVADLAGKRIILAHNNKSGASTFLDAVEELLKKKYPTATFLRQFSTDINLAGEPAFYNEVARAGDAFIFGAGD